MNETVRYFEKATAFVTRYNDGRHELLTFLHPLAGRQLPAGSVEPDEGPIEAAERETIEETGVSDFERVKYLGTEEVQLSGRGIMCTTQPAHSQRRGHSTDKEVPLFPVGYNVDLLKRKDDWLLVSHTTYDFNVDPPIALKSVEGWVRRDHVATTLKRHFVWLEARNDGRECWKSCADGHTFVVEWVPLNPKPELVKGQDEWLDQHYEALIG